MAASRTTIDALEAALAPGPYICGEQFTAADVYVGAQIGWGMMFGTIEKRPAFEDYFAPPPGPPGRDPRQRARRCGDAEAGAAQAAAGMSDDRLRAEAIALYDRFTHEGMDRRAFMAELTRIAAARRRRRCCSPASPPTRRRAPQVAADDPRICVGHASSFRPTPAGRSVRLSARAERDPDAGQPAGPRHPRESRPQRAYPRRHPAAGAGRLSRGRARFPVAQPAARRRTRIAARTAIGALDIAARRSPTAST